MPSPGRLVDAASLAKLAAGPGATAQTARTRTRRVGALEVRAALARRSGSVMNIPVELRDVDAHAVAEALLA